LDIEDLFSSSRNLIASANEHIDEVAEGFRRVFDDHPGEIVSELDPQTGDQIHWYRLYAPVPAKLKVRVFNIATELRAALDHSVYAASVLLGERPDPTRTAFPFGDNPAIFEGEISKRCKHVPAGVVALLRTLNPYPGGDETLWRLNKLRNTKDHRRLLEAGATVLGLHLKGEVRLSDDYAGPMPPVIVWRPTLPHREYHVPIVRLPAGTHADYKLNKLISIVFGDPPEVAGRSVIDFLVEAKQAVQLADWKIMRETVRVLKARTV
jgi:hypothetical protein